MKLSEEVFEEEQRKFSISTFSELISKSFQIQLPSKRRIWHPSATQMKTRRSYNMITMILSLKSHLSSSACYRQLHQLECISLPHESSLRRLYSSFGLDTDILPYLKSETSIFSQSERHLSLNLDEIHVKSNITYKVKLY